MTVHVPEELLAGELLTCMDDAREKWVAQPHTLLPAGFGTELELHGLDVDPYVFMVQGGDAVRMILSFVFLVADANQRLVHQPPRGREHLVAGQSLEGE